MSEILLLNPLGSDYQNTEIQSVLAGRTSSDDTVTARSLAPGVTATAFLPLPQNSYSQLIGAVVQAEREGFDAVVINCAADPVVAIAKSLVSIPVTGPMEAALHEAEHLVRVDEAKTLFFTCTTWGGLQDPVRERLGVRVFDPLIDTARFASLVAAVGAAA
jgi:Asp/Glu/hydantoin racemase